MADDHPYMRRRVIESFEKVIGHSAIQILEQCSKRDTTEGTVQRGAEGVTLKRDTPACHTSTDLT